MPNRGGRFSAAPACRSPVMREMPFGVDFPNGEALEARHVGARFHRFQSLSREAGHCCGDIFECWLGDTHEARDLKVLRAFEIEAERVPRSVGTAWKMASLAHWKARVVTVDSTIAGILYGCGGGSGSATGAGLPEPPTRSGWGLTALFQNRTARSTIR